MLRLTGLITDAKKQNSESKRKTDDMTEIEKYFSEFERLGVIKAVFSLPTDGCPYKKTVIR